MLKYYVEMSAVFEVEADTPEEAARKMQGVKRATFDVAVYDTDPVPGETVPILLAKSTEGWPTDQME